MTVADGDRPKTAFESYLKQKQDGSAPKVAPFQTFKDPTKQSPGQTQQFPKALPHFQPPGTRQGSNMKPQASSGIPAHRPGTATRDGPSHQGPGAGALGASALGIGARPSSSSSQAGGLQDLAVAAASLAQAARSLAASPKVDHKSFETLAKAAQDLAAGIGPSASNPAAANSRGLPPLPAVDPSKQGAPSSVLPFAAGAAGALQRGAKPPTPGGKARVSTPKFPGYNPLIHIRQSELPPPGTAQGRPGTGARPGTSNPITHAMEDLRPGTAAQLLSRGGSRGGTGSRGSGYGYGYGQGGSPAGPRGPPSAGDSGCNQAQVFTVGGPEDQQGQQGRPGTRGGAGTPVDFIEFAMKHPRRMRLDHWPPATPLYEEDIVDDEMAMRYNSALLSIRDRIYTHGVNGVAGRFRMVDRDNSGSIDTAEFKHLLKELDLGAEVVDEKVLDLIANSIDADHSGSINYMEFINSFRFNKLPYKPYSRKFKHRTTGNPDMPFGPTQLKHPYGVLSDIDSNKARELQKLGQVWGHVEEAFKYMDKDNDGIIQLGEFKKALSLIDEKHNLHFTDEYITKIFKEADIDYSQGIDYKEFIAGFTRDGSSHFMPEFLKPKTLRSSTLLPPWEFRQHRSPKYETSAIGSNGFDTEGPTHMDGIQRNPPKEF